MNTISFPGVTQRRIRLWTLVFPRKTCLQTTRFANTPSGMHAVLDVTKTRGDGPDRTRTAETRVSVKNISYAYTIYESRSRIRVLKTTIYTVIWAAGQSFRLYRKRRNLNFVFYSNALRENASPNDEYLKEYGENDYYYVHLYRAF